MIKGLGRYRYPQQNPPILFSALGSRIFNHLMFILINAGGTGADSDPFAQFSGNGTVQSLSYELRGRRYARLRGLIGRYFDADCVAVEMGAHVKSCGRPDVAGLLLHQGSGSGLG